MTEKIKSAEELALAVQEEYTREQAELDKFVPKLELERKPFILKSTGEMKYSYEINGQYDGKPIRIEMALEFIIEYTGLELFFAGKTKLPLTIENKVYKDSFNKKAISRTYMIVKQGAYGEIEKFPIKPKDKGYSHLMNMYINREIARLKWEHSQKSKPQ